MIQHDGTLKIDDWYIYEEDITPYFELNVDIMPNIDFRHVSEQSAIYSAFVLGDQQIFDQIVATCHELAEMAVKFNFSGYVLDYEPYFDYSIEHTRAYLSFASIMKHAIDGVDSRISPDSAGYPYRRV